MQKTSVNTDELESVFELMNSPTLKKYRLKNYVFLLSTYLNLFQHQQKKIIAIAESHNSTIQNSSAGLSKLNQSVKNYDQLLVSVNKVRNALFSMSNDLSVDEKQDIINRLQRLKSFRDKKQYLELAATKYRERQYQHKVTQVIELLKAYILPIIFIFLFIVVLFFLKSVHQKKRGALNGNDDVEAKTK